MNDDTKIYQQQGFAHNVGIGERPAIVTVDFTNGFNDPSTSVVATSMRQSEERVLC